MKAIVFALVSFFAFSASMTAAEKEEVKLTGTVLTRQDGSLIQVVVEKNNFVIRFWTKDKQPLPVPFDRAIVRYDPVYKRPQTEVLNPTGDKKEYKSPIFVRPPHVFPVILNFFNDGSDKAVETYTFRYDGD